ncbi:hypothetical protein Dvina_33345 [Dactylosporangium vinaceum]|uniref:DUF3592 domain-containing protein n=1 Tax=Dactylosporangium vinaceum TaxID=53362 RepID=A0ABV5M9X9_9ACTN|nr:hypothetical protein [Dactylosporangium vinaceum]UAB93160.1 hypothetical protein Dvina_33345 [Dactylosporangium vinaceum]
MRRLRDRPPGQRRSFYRFGALFVLGFGVLVATLIGVVHEHAESARLRAAGVPVSAEVTGWSTANRSARPFGFEISYVHEGLAHAAGVHCNPPKSCPITTGGRIRIFVDPDRPEHFVTEFGDTDASTIWFTNAGLLIPGVAGTLFGGLAAYQALTRTEPAPQAPPRGPGHPRPRSRRGRLRRRRF